MNVGLIAFGAVSSLGEGRSAVSAGEEGAPARVAIARDPELAAAGLARPYAARARLELPPDRATALLTHALFECASKLDRVRPAWRSERVGLVLGTSSGGMRQGEAAWATIARGGVVNDVESPTYWGPMAKAARALGMPLAPSMLVLGACASGALAIGLAGRWLQRDSCDIVLAGGFDDVTVFVAAGFEALRATTAHPPPRPFRVGRDGVVLGEGAAVVALGLPTASSRIFVTGFGAASDAMQLTAPDPEGAGLARAAIAALREAREPAVDLVSAHATATSFNDTAEARAIARALGERTHEAVVHPFKAQIGHTLGAAGALELLASVDAIVQGLLPGAAGEGPIEEGMLLRLLDRSARGTPRVALKLASAFGGVDAALVVADQPGERAKPFRPAFLHGAVGIEREPSLYELARATRCHPDRLGRADGLVRLTLAACARLEAEFGSLAGAGIVVGSAFSTLETNALFAQRIRERGARAAEPRRFPYTSPTAASGECSIAFGLTGPSFAVGGGMHAALEALAAGALLIEGGNTDRVVVVAVDDAGPITRAFGGLAIRSGAVALLLSCESEDARVRVGALELRRGRPASASGAPGHLALRPLIETVGPCELICTSPPDAFARIELI